MATHCRLTLALLRSTAGSATLAIFRSAAGPAALGLAAFLAAALPATEAAGQTPLVDAARQERARRAAIPPDQKARVYTNDDLRDSGGLTIGLGALPSAATPAAGDAAPEPAAPGAAEGQPGAGAGDPGAGEAAASAAAAAADGAARGEEYWRQRMAAARGAQARATLLAAALQNRADGLWAQFTATDDPVQRGVVEQQRLEALAAIEEMRTERQRLDQELQAVEEEARRADVPPGWLREPAAR